MALFASCAFAAIIAWLILRAFAQRNLLPSLGAAGPAAEQSAPQLTVIIPARDEESNIRGCLACILEQTYPRGRLKVLVADDHSTDATAPAVQEIARQDRRVLLLQTPPLPAGWTGKCLACWTGAKAAAGAEWLCFLDADMRAAPELLASAVAAAKAGGLDMLSLAPRHELGSFAERLVIPCGLYYLGFRQNLRKLQSPRCDGVTVTGQFLLVRGGIYEAAGGHAAVRGSICEDVALARLLKRRGGKVALYDGKNLLSTRMYTGWRTLWPGFTKNAVDMAGGIAAALWGAAVAIVLAWAAWLVPVAAGVLYLRCGAGACEALIPALAGSAAAFALHLAGASHFRIPLWYGLIFPAGYTAGAIIAADSVRRRLCGRITWKGRTYP